LYKPDLPVLSDFIKPPAVDYRRRTTSRIAKVAGKDHFLTLSSKKALLRAS
jgi:hypothetical protein